jgi:hypothetical protein
MSLGFLPMTKRRVECCGIPLKPKQGLNGAPSFYCIWREPQSLGCVRDDKGRSGASMGNWLVAERIADRSPTARGPILTPVSFLVVLRCGLI